MAKNLQNFTNVAKFLTILVTLEERDRDGKEVLMKTLNRSPSNQNRSKNVLERVRERVCVCVCHPPLGIKLE